MPLFRRKSEEERQQEEQSRQRAVEEQARAQASLEALTQGGIPLEAQGRLENFRQQGGKFFTSDLSVQELLLTREAGFRPLTQVMGSSIYHVGWRNLPSRSWSGSRELEVVSQATNNCRMLALNRMQQEARLAGAHAVVGVRVLKQRHEWSDNMVEFNSVGTAVRREGSPDVEHPALTSLNGQDFWKLYKAGYWPLGVVASTAVFYVVASWNTRRAMGSTWFGTGRANQELGDFTQGLYIARHLAMNHVREQATRLGASGIVGMEIEQEEEEYEVEISENNHRTDMIFTFHAIGTAITELAGRESQLRVFSAVNLKGKAER